MKTIKYLITFILTNGFMGYAFYEYLYIQSGWGNLFLLYTWVMAVALPILSIAVSVQRNEEFIINKRKEYQATFKFPVWFVVGMDFILVGLLAYHSKFLLAGAWLWLMWWQYFSLSILKQPVAPEEEHKAGVKKMVNKILEDKIT